MRMMIFRLGCVRLLGAKTEKKVRGKEFSSPSSMKFKFRRL